jgi:predicted nucleic acid-binding protein
MIVVDASIVIAAVVSDEPLHSHVQRKLLDWQVRNEQCIAPPLFYAEITAVCRKLVMQQRYSPLDARDILHQMLMFPVEIISHHDIYVRAFDLANAHGLSRAYDTQYIALAQSSACDCWTADQRLVNTVSRSLPFVRWVGEDNQ